jgi:hypothetical protein
MLISEIPELPVPVPEVDQLKALMADIEANVEGAQAIMQQVVRLKLKEARPLEELKGQWTRTMLEDEANILLALVKCIQDSLDGLNALGVIVPQRSFLCSDLAYVNWLLAANTLLTRSTTNIQNTTLPSNWLEMEFFPTISDLNSLWSSPARNLVQQGWKLEKLSELMAICEDERVKLLEDKSVKSLEELEAITKRLVQLPAVPMEALDLLQRLKLGKKWEHDVSLSFSDKNKLGLKQALDLEHQADIVGIPPCSILRRQLHNRIQDVRRWEARALGLFKHPTSATTAIADDSITFCLQDVMDQAHLFQEEHMSLICVCQQVFSEKAASPPLLRCFGCAQL